VDQFAQYGERLLLGLLIGQGDGVADAKAHPEMFGENDVHINFAPQSM